MCWKVECPSPRDLSFSVPSIFSFVELIASNNTHCLYLIADSVISIRPLLSAPSATRHRMPFHSHMLGTAAED